jgi:hypothetical protein
MSQEIIQSLTHLAKTIRAIQEPTASDNMIHNYMMAQNAKVQNEEMKTVVTNISEGIGSLQDIIKANPTPQNIDSVMSQLDTMELNFKNGYSNYFDSDSPVWDSFDTARNSIKLAKDNVESYQKVEGKLNDLQNNYNSIFENAFLGNEGADNYRTIDGLSDDFKDVWSYAKANNLNEMEIKNNANYREQLDQQRINMNEILIQLDSFQRLIDSDSATAGIQIKNKFKDNPMVDYLIGLIDAGGITQTELVLDKQSGTVSKVPSFKKTMEKYIDDILTKQVGRDTSMMLKKQAVDKQEGIKLAKNFENAIGKIEYLVEDGDAIRKAIEEIAISAQINPEEVSFTEELPSGQIITTGINYNDDDILAILDNLNINKDDRVIMNAIDAGVNYIQGTSNAENSFISFEGPRSYPTIINNAIAENIATKHERALSESPLFQKGGDGSYEKLREIYNEYTDGTNADKFVGKEGFWGGSENYSFHGALEPFLRVSADIGSSLKTKETIGRVFAQHEQKFTDFTDFIINTLKDEGKTNKLADWEAWRELPTGEVKYEKAIQLMDELTADGTAGKIFTERLTMGKLHPKVNLFLLDYAPRRIKAHLNLWRLTQTGGINPLSQVDSTTSGATGSDYEDQGELE